MTFDYGKYAPRLQQALSGDAGRRFRRMVAWILAAAVLTAFFVMHGLLFSIWGVWMLCYGLAICAVGLFSVKPVSVLGGDRFGLGRGRLAPPRRCQG